MNTVRRERHGAGRGRRRGSATVEFLAVAPFVLVITLAFWDVRSYIAYRTDLARELFVAAEVIANELNANPIESVMGEAIGRLAAVSAGSAAVAVVTRGTQRGGGVACVDPNAWCLPRVALVWPTTPADGLWNGGGDCANDPSVGRLPARGDHFGAVETVMPNENPGGAVPQEDWLSRNMVPTEWWVVIDACFQPTGGLFTGAITAGIGAFDVTDQVLRRRAAWGSVEDRGSCAWCGP